MSFDDAAAVPNVLTIDFESWVHAYQDARVDSEGRKSLDAGFVVEAGLRLLDIIDEQDVTATFFVVGEIADWYPELLDEIAHRGHEIGLHAYRHVPIRSQVELYHELERSAAFIRRYAVTGFRAPRGIFRKEYLQLLREYGLAYDSSSYGAWSTINRVRGVLEIPISARNHRHGRQDRFHFGPLSWRVLRNVYPYGSPFLLGLAGNISLRFVRMENRAGRSSVMCIHLWQIFHPSGGARFLAHFLSRELSSWPYCIRRHGLFRRLLKLSPFITLGRLARDITNGDRNRKLT